MDKIRVFNCTQTKVGEPIFEGICSDLGDRIYLMEAESAYEVACYRHNIGLKKGIAIGVGAVLYGLAMRWAFKKLYGVDKD